MEDGVDLIADHATERDSGPLGNHRRDSLAVDLGEKHRRLALQLVKLAAGSAQLLMSLLTLIGAATEGKIGISLPADRLEPLLQLPGMLLLLPELLLGLLQIVPVLVALGLLALQDLGLELQSLRAAP